MTFTGRETPKEVLSFLEGEGYWTYEDTGDRIIMWNGIDYWKVSRTRGTYNNLEHYHYPNDTIFITPNSLYMQSVSPAIHLDLYKSTAI